VRGHQERNFEKFGEAKELHKLTGLFSVSNANELSEIMNKLVTNEEFRKQTGIISGHYVSSNRGATAIIVEHLTQNISKPTLLNLSD